MSLVGLVEVCMKLNKHGKKKDNPTIPYTKHTASEELWFEHCEKNAGFEKCQV